jgi:hypothetical protein
MPRPLTPEGACVQLIHTALALDEISRTSEKAGGAKFRNIVIRSLEEPQTAFSMGTSWVDRVIGRPFSWCGKEVIAYDLESNLDYLEQLFVEVSQCSQAALDVPLADPVFARKLGQKFKDDVRHILANLLNRVETIFLNSCPGDSKRRHICEERLDIIRNIFNRIQAFPAIAGSIAETYALSEPALKNEAQFNQERASFYKHVKDHIDQLKMESCRHSLDMKGFCDDWDKAFWCVKEKIGELRAKYTRIKFQGDLDEVEYVVNQRLSRAVHERLRAIFDDFTSSMLSEIKKPRNFADFCMKKNEIQKQFCSLFCGEPDWREKLGNKERIEEFDGRLIEMSHLFQEVQFERYRFFIERDLLPIARKFLKEAMEQKDITLLIPLKVEVDSKLSIIGGVLSKFREKEGMADRAEIQLLSQVHDMLERTSHYIEGRLKNWPQSAQGASSSGPTSQVGNVSDGSIVVTNSQNVTINISKGSSFDLTSLLSSPLLAKYGSTVLLTAVSSYIFGGLPLGWALATGIASATAPLAARGIVHSLVPSALAAWLDPIADYATTLLVYYYGQQGVNMLRNFTSPASTSAPAPAQETRPQPSPQQNPAPSSSIPVPHVTVARNVHTQAAAQGLPLAIAPPPVLSPAQAAPLANVLRAGRPALLAIAPPPAAQVASQPNVPSRNIHGSFFTSLFQNFSRGAEQPAEQGPQAVLEPIRSVVPTAALSGPELVASAVPSNPIEPNYKPEEHFSSAASDPELVAKAAPLNPFPIADPVPEISLPTVLPEQKSSGWLSKKIFGGLVSGSAKVAALASLVFFTKHEIDTNRAQIAI